ncbi:hypothetical protein GCM10022221_29510 [Actinocorallia aurea]
MRDTVLILGLVLGLYLVGRSLAEPPLAAPPGPAANTPATYYADHTAPLAHCPPGSLSAYLATRTAALR